MPRVVVDRQRCKGCERCVEACVEANGLDPIKAEVDRATTRDGLSANRLSSILPVEEGRFARKSCLHCLEPSCVSACLVGGITKTDAGPVVYDPDKCIGCRYCMLACPFHVPRYEWSKTTPFMRKCHLCFERADAGGVPACVEACRNVGANAMHCGDLNDADSDVSRMIAAGGAMRLREDLGTEPKVFYLGL